MSFDVAVEGIPSSAASDQSLVRKAAVGSQSAATDLYHRYADRIRRLVRANLSRELAPRLDAEDIVQSVFRRFFGANRRDRYDLPTDANLWNLLFTITLNRIRTAEQFHRAQRRNVRKSMAADAQTAGLQSNPSADDDALALVVNEALDLLPGPHRAIVRLRLDGYDIAEIADRVHRSKRTIERMLQEVRQRLRTILEVEDSNDPDPDAAHL